MKAAFIESSTIAREYKKTVRFLFDLNQEKNFSAKIPNRKIEVMQLIQIISFMKKMSYLINITIWTIMSNRITIRKSWITDTDLLTTLSIEDLIDWPVCLTKRSIMNWPKA
jgi:hypothetical protein